MVNASTSGPDIPGYRILRRLGSGGMSEIWLAEQVVLARPVAIKIVNPGEEAEARLARFRQEASLVARFDHPNVVGIIEFGETADGRLFFSMPYVPNGTLAEAGLCGDSPRAREVLAQVLDALAYVHEHGVVHRDVKPENVLFDNVGRARLADFGVSRSIIGVSRHTRVGETFGSSHYMSPEQARGEVPDGRSDLYSLGAVAFEILTGRPPYEGPDHLSVVVAHLQSPIPRLPEELRQWQLWIDTALAKRPEHRYPNALAMRQALARIPESARYGWSGSMRSALKWGLPAAIAVLLGLAVWRFSNVQPAPADAVVESASTIEPVREPVSPLVDDGTGSTGAEHEADPPNGVLADALIEGDQTVDAGSSIEPPALDGAGAPADNTAAMTESETGFEPAEEPSTALPAATDVATTPSSRPRTRPEPPVSAPAPPAEVPVESTASPTPFSATFESVPKIPLFLLTGSRSEQLERIDDYLEHGRRTIDADRSNVEKQRRSAEDAALRQQLRDDYDSRKANYETWRQQLLALRKTVASSDG